MIYVPFIYFSLLLYLTIKKNGVQNVSVPLIAFYVLITFGSIIIDVQNLYAGNCPKPSNGYGFIPTMLFCGVLTLSFFPFIRLGDKEVLHIAEPKKIVYIDYLVYFFFVDFCIMAILLSHDLVRNFTLSAMDSSLKEAFWTGDEELISLQGIPKLIATRCMLFSKASLFLIPIFFYNLAFRKKKMSYLFINFFGTCCILFTSILALDRSKSVYWILTFIVCFVFYSKYLPKKTIKKIVFVSCIGASLFLLYIYIINIRRFGDTNDYSDENITLINYMGQSYINFCVFYDKINLSNYCIDGPFPFVSRYILGENISTRDWAFYINRTYGVNALVFSTYYGFLSTYIGFFFATIWVIVISFFSKKLLVLEETITIYKMELIFILILFPLLGGFGYYFHEPLTEFFAVSILLILKKAS